MNDPVQNGISQSRVGDVFMPFLNRQLTGSLIYQVRRMHYIDEQGQPVIDSKTGKVKKTFQ
jgi:hypothetical protein